MKDCTQLPIDTCAICGAIVYPRMRRTHAEWHASLVTPQDVDAKILHQARLYS